MKKLIFEYLNVTYPNIHLIRTGAGDIVEGYDSKLGWYQIREEMVITVIKLFCINHLTTSEIVNEWVNNRTSCQKMSNTNSVYVCSSYTTSSSTIF